MDDPHDHDGVVNQSVINGVRAVKGDAEVGGQFLAGGTRAWEVQQWLERSLDGGEKAGRHVFRRRGREGCPDFSQVRFGRLR